MNVPPSLQGGGMAGARRKILVADDDPTALTLFRYRLRALGYDILTAAG